MAEFYHSTTCEIAAETGVDVLWCESGKQFHLWIGGGLSKITIMIDPVQMERLAESLRVALREHDIRTGRFVPDDGDGLTPGGKPVKTAG